MQGRAPQTVEPDSPKFECPQWVENGHKTVPLQLGKSYLSALVSYSQRTTRIQRTLGAAILRRPSTIVRQASKMIRGGDGNVIVSWRRPENGAADSRFFGRRPHRAQIIS